MNKPATSNDADILVSHEFLEEKFASIISALQARKLFICVQPKVILPDCDIVGGEACLRWNEPDIGIIFPAEFIPVAQSAGLMEMLDLYAIEEACTSLCDWLANGLKPVPLSVNLSSSALLSPGFVDAVKGCMMRHKLCSKLIEFEFSMVFMRDYPEEFAKVIEYFHENGFKCVVDGFAQAQSMLKDALRYNIDTLKLDCRAFTKDNEDEGVKECAKVFRELDDMGVNLIIEGVETPRQAEMLYEMGCTTMQGYGLGMPISTRLFGRMLRGK